MRLKNLLFAGMAATVLMSSCKKDDKNDAPSNSWKLNGTSYSSTQVVRVSMSGVNSLNASSTNGTNTHTVLVNFGSSMPTSNTTMKVGTGSNELMIVTGSTSGNEAYMSTASSSGDAKITVDNGKIAVEIPEVTLTKPGGTETATFSGRIAEM